MTIDNQYIFNAITTKIKPNKLILFGSQATDKASKDSDIDLLFIFDKIESKIKEKRKIREAMKDIAMPKDIIVATKEEFDFYKNQTGSIFKEANEKGIVLWSI